MTQEAGGGRRAFGRPRFVILVWALVPGGTLSVLRDWVPRLAQRGDVWIISLGPNRESLGVPTAVVGGRRIHPFRFPNAVGYVVRMMVAATRTARGRGRVVLLAQDALATGAAAALAGYLAGARVAVMEHGSAAAIDTQQFWSERTARGWLGRLRQLLLRATLRVLHALVLWRLDVALVAGDEADARFRARGVGANRLLRYRFGIDLELFHPPSTVERAAARHRWRVDDARHVVICVSRLAPEKGVDDLIAALAGIPGDLAPRLIVAGDGPLRPDLERAAAVAGVDVTFVGALEPSNVASILHAADCFVYPAVRGANTPFAVLEAMSSGLPVVATTAPTVHRAMLADGRGVAIQPADVDALRSAIIGYLGDRSAAAAAGVAARAYVVAEHAPAQVDQAVAAFVDRLWPVC